MKRQCVADEGGVRCRQRRDPKCSCGLCKLHFNASKTRPVSVYVRVALRKARADAAEQAVRIGNDDVMERAEALRGIYANDE